MLKRITYAVGSLLLALALFCLWYSIAANYDYDALAGTYKFSGDGETSVLVLKADRTFQQTRTQAGQVAHAMGTWYREGEGGVVFSGEFLPLPGQRSFADSPGSEDATKPKPEFYGHFEKILTVYPKLSLDAGDKEIVLHKTLFR